MGSLSPLTWHGHPLIIPVDIYGGQYITAKWAGVLENIAFNTGEKDGMDSLPLGVEG